MPRNHADLIVRNANEVTTCEAGTRGARGSDLDHIDPIADGAVAIRDGRIVAVGTTSEIDREWESQALIDATGNLVSPGFVDAHSHLVFSGWRHEEWEQRVKERPALHVDAGIQGTMKRTRNAPLDQLHDQALTDLASGLLHGTTTLESKSGYGLDRETELRTLQVLRKLNDEQPIDIVTTYLGAHVIPPEYEDDRDAYIRLVLEMIDEVASLVDYCDITCDPVGFTAEESRSIAEHATNAGVAIRFHADQTGRSGGTQLAAEFGASSADHLECASEQDILALASSNTVGVLLPGVTHHLMHPTPSASTETTNGTAAQMTPAKVRLMVESGCCLALATDYNPGTCPTISMQMVMQLAARIYRIGYAEAWKMATINGAIALDKGHDRGSIEAGKLADLVIWQVPEHGMVINRFGSNMVKTVIKTGLVVVDHGRPSEISRS